MSKRYPIDFMFSRTTKSEEYFVYAEVYKQALELILEKFSEKPPLRSHSLAPVVFLLRQYIELQLKGIIFFGESTHIPIGHHDIQPLYKQAMANVKQKYGIKRLRKINPDVEKFIKCLSKFDWKGEAFRYPENLDGKGFAEMIGEMDSWLYQEISALGTLVDIAKKVIHDLENMEGYLNAMRENEQENWANQ